MCHLMTFINVTLGLKEGESCSGNTVCAGGKYTHNCDGVCTCEPSAFDEITVDNVIKCEKSEFKPTIK